MPDLSRQIINTLLPEGIAWQPKSDDDYDLLLNGIGDNSDVIIDDMEQLAYLRDPERTIMLPDLEKEYGVIPVTGSTEEERRSRLKAFRYRRTSTGAADMMQAKLREAGFDDVYVHVNSPAIDPAMFLTQAFNMMCGDLLPGGNDAQCGEPEAICASLGGELIVNGDLFSQTPNYVNKCDEPGVCCGADIFCGDFDGYKSLSMDISYEIPTVSGYWSLFFFVGGPATRDPVTNAITAIDFYGVPNQRRVEFRRTILRFKPLHSWGGLIVIYT